MAQKQIIPPYKTITAGDMSKPTLTSGVTNISGVDNIAIQLVWTGSPTGSFDVQVSLDYRPNPVGGTPLNAGTWASLTLDKTVAAAGSASNDMVFLYAIPAPYLRTVYTATSGTGSLTVMVSGRAV